MNPTLTRLNPNQEWLETDGLGGFASGTVTGPRTRRYHALLLTALTPPTGRLVLVNGFDAWIETPQGRYDLTTQRYQPDVLAPDSAHRIAAFVSEPWPHWRFRTEDGTELSHELLATHGAPCTRLSWRLEQQRAGVKLCVRPFLSGRDYHALHKENTQFRFEPAVQDQMVTWQSYDGLPAIQAISNGAYRHEPNWYRNFLYTEEANRGLDCTEDLAAPGVFEWELSGGKEAVLVFTTPDTPRLHLETLDHPNYSNARTTERLRRDQLRTPLDRAANAYIVARAVPSTNAATHEQSTSERARKTIIAGYPWFTDWGRDTFIALRGLCLATGRLEDARDILLDWAGAVSEGMLPNRFPDQGTQPEFNAVEASLWFIIATFEYLQAVAYGPSPASPPPPSLPSSSPAARGKRMPSSTHGAAPETRWQSPDEAILMGAVDAILEGYTRGTRFGIRADHNDGLLACGEPGAQLTWMDAKIGEWVVTPRIGKPVEVQALWLNALRIGALNSNRWQTILEQGLATFQSRFWNPDLDCLFDVIDANHQPGTVENTFRPNQIFAIGGLPFPLLTGPRARAVVDAVESQLWTRPGLRSLAQEDPHYTPFYMGGVSQRDAAYHQGTVWPWLLGPFVEAWVRVRGGTTAVRRKARTKFLAPLLAHLGEAGLGHVSEITDAESPHDPRGCPFQAWSLGELLRLDRIVLKEIPETTQPTSTQPAEDLRPRRLRSRTKIPTKTPAAGGLHHPPFPRRRRNAVTLNLTRKLRS